jgi:hypothetical protein
LKNFNCATYGAYNVLDADKSVHCDRPSEFAVCWLVATIFISLYTIGIPSLLLFILVRYESPRADKRIAKLDITEAEREQMERRWNERAAFFRRKYEVRL